MKVACSIDWNNVPPFDNRGAHTTDLDIKVSGSGYRIGLHVPAAGQQHELSQTIFTGYREPAFSARARAGLATQLNACSALQPRSSIAGVALRRAAMQIQAGRPGH